MEISYPKSSSGRSQLFEELNKTLPLFSLPELFHLFLGLSSLTRSHFFKDGDFITKVLALFFGGCFFLISAPGQSKFHHHFTLSSVSFAHCSRICHHFHAYATLAAPPLRGT